jgi:UTP--glucose-1-phosphate uridylyltransferase
MNVKKAVFPVGGWGTRFLPATKVVPKAMFPIIDKPIIHYVIEEATCSGIEQVVFSITPNNQAIEDYFNRSLELEAHLEKKGKLDLLHQIQEISGLAYFSSTRSTLRPKQIGLGMAILNTKPIVGDEPFAVCLPNDLIDAETPCLTSLLAIYETLKCPIFAVCRVPEKDISIYGNISFEELDKESIKTLSKGPYIPSRLYRVQKIIQKPDPAKHEHLSNMAIIGRFILPPEIFTILENLKPGYENEVQLTDAIELLRQSGQKIYAYEFDGSYYDTRSKLGYIKACLGYALKQPELASSIRAFLAHSNH